MRDGFSYFRRMKGRIFFFLLLFISACRQKDSKISRIVVRMSGTSADSVMLRRISFNNDPGGKLDSGMLRFSRDSLVFELPLSSDSLYEFSLKFAPNKIYCIPDATDIVILMNKKNGTNQVYGSPGSVSILNFNAAQDSLLWHVRTLQYSKQTANNKTGNPKSADSLPQVLKDAYRNIQERYIHFADTVSGTAAFMQNFDRIDFQSDFTTMKNVVGNAEKRFPKSAAIARLNDQVLNLVHIKETELQVGDIFPDLELPDLKGRPFSLKTINGKYFYIDFWSSWCHACMPYDPVRAEISRDQRFEKLVLIHVAMDDHLKNCMEIVEKNKMPGIQLIDQKIWQGETARKLAFDSIPYNFLVGPDNHIISKAIPADSLISILKIHIR
jgi:thiol-disulfide isomerase/thioredoxin